MLNDILRGRYKIIKHLGGGGFGQTYLAEDIDLPKHPICVVKQLKPSSKEPNVLAISKRLFDQEAEALYSLGSHDRIPRLLAHFQEGKEFYLVQEFADGKDLSHEIGKGIRLPEVLAIPLLTEILEILVFIHNRGVVHRDIKPANLIRRKSDRKIVLIDFGAVKEIGSLAVDSQGNTNLTIAIGSPGYMPIEQINGKPRFSSDIYAVGMLMIQAITGAEPRRFDEHPETAELIWRDRVPPDSYSSQFLNILEKMVRYDFRQRYQSAKEVLAAISLIASTSTSNYELQTVVTSSIDRSQSNGKDLDRTQVDRTQVDLLPLTQEPREDRQNKKSLPWAKILIGGASAAVLLAIAGITKFYQTPSNSKNEVVNNAPQPTSEPSPDLSAPPPEPKVRAAPTPPNSPEERLIREAKILNRFDKPLEALVKVEEALKLDLKNANAWEVKGLILVKLRRESEAIAAFDQAIELKPNSASAKQYRDLLLTTIKPNLKKP